MSTANPSPRRRLVTIAQVADYLGYTPRTIRNHIAQGFYPAYRIPRTRGVRLDLDEVLRAMKVMPTARARSGFGSFGPNATIIDLPPQSVRVYAEPGSVVAPSNTESETNR
jgi:excisionase family DNA binding protein